MPTFYSLRAARRTSWRSCSAIRDPTDCSYVLRLPSRHSMHPRRRTIRPSLRPVLPPVVSEELLCTCEKKHGSLLHCCKIHGRRSSSPRTIGRSKRNLLMPACCSNVPGKPATVTQPNLFSNGSTRTMWKVTRSDIWPHGFEKRGRNAHPPRHCAASYEHARLGS